MWKRACDTVQYFLKAGAMSSELCHCFSQAIFLYLLGKLHSFQQDNARLISQNSKLLQQLSDIESKIKENLLPQVPAPLGEVTVVFTDVQGSTSQWEANPDVMAEALALHNRIIRELLEEFKGYEVKAHGDSFMVAFADPSTAIKWSMAVQSALFNALWPVELLEHPDAAEEYDVLGKVKSRGLKVRIGINMGKPNTALDPVTGRLDYFGPMVNKTSRLLEVARGGQVVVSRRVQEVANLFADELQVVVCYIGSFKLKGIGQETEIFEIIPAVKTAVVAIE